MKRYFSLLLLAVLAVLLFSAGCEIDTPNHEPVYYTITYFGNGNDAGTAPIDSNRYANGTPVTILDKGTLSKAGHIFSNWNTNPI
jgi:hypothetical protein